MCKIIFLFYLRNPGGEKGKFIFDTLGEKGKIYFRYPGGKRGNLFSIPRIVENSGKI